MNRSFSFIFLGLLLVALAALFVLCFQIQIFSLHSQFYLALQHTIFPAWWVAR